MVIMSDWVYGHKGEEGKEGETEVSQRVHFGFSSGSAAPPLPDGETVHLFAGQRYHKELLSAAVQPALSSSWG